MARTKVGGKGAAPHGARCSRRRAPAGGRRPRRRRPLRPHAAPADLRRTTSAQAKHKDNLRVFVAGGAQPRGAARPPASVRPARSRQDDHGADPGARDGRAAPHDQRPGRRATRGRWPASSHKLQPHDILFIDEIHRLNSIVEESLYPAMEDFRIDHHDRRGGLRQHPDHRRAAVHPGGGDDAHRPPQRAPALALRAHRTSGTFYPVSELTQIVLRSANLLGVAIDDKAATAIALAQPRHPARGQPPAPPRARLRRGARQRHGRRGRGRPRQRAARDRRRRLRRDGSPAPVDHHRRLRRRTGRGRDAGGGAR